MKEKDPAISVSIFVKTMYIIVAPIIYIVAPIILIILSLRCPLFFSGKTSAQATLISAHNFLYYNPN